MIENLLLAVGMTVDRFVIWNLFIKKTSHPAHVQYLVLKRILKKNKDTAFGREHHFASIQDYHSYRDTVPVQRYSDLDPYIQKGIKTGKSYITDKHPILYARTSGTTNKPKLIPILQSTINAYKWSQRIFLYAQYDSFPEMFSGRLLAIVSPAIEGYLENGIPYGSMSGLVYKEMPWFTKRKFILPPEVLGIENYDLKYIVIAIFSLAVKDVTAMGSANPSTFIKLLDIINTKQQEIVYVIRTGDFSKLQGFSEAEGNGVEKIFQANTYRAGELDKIFTSHDRVTYAHLWPNLKVVSTWTAGSCSILVPALQEDLSPNTHIVEAGYFASEFRGTITIDAKNNRAVPAIHETFFEFVEKNAWENDTHEFQTIETIKPGNQYYVFITTSNGLYRYDMNDIIEVTGYFNKTPTIVFVQKGKGVTNLTGEKLYEEQVLHVLRLLEEEKLIKPTFFIMLADDKELVYTLYIEDTIKSTHADLAHLADMNFSSVNIEYEAKRRSGRLKPLRVIFLKHGTGDIYKKEFLQRGARENQFKVLPLRYKRDFAFNIEKYSL